MTSVAPLLPESSRARFRRTPAEREFFIGAADADDALHVYVDVPSRFARRLLQVARAWDVTPVTLEGGGVEFTLPLRAVRFAAPSAARAPASDAQRANLARGREARQKALFHTRALDRNQGSASPAARPDPDTGAPATPVQTGLLPQTTA